MRVLSAALRRHACCCAFQNFQQCLLYAFAADITGNGYVFGFLGDLIDFVDINDTAFRFFNIIICCLNQFQQDIFYVFPYIASFCQRSSIRDSERHLQYSCQCLCQQGFTSTGGTYQQDIAFLQFHIVCLGVAENSL